MAPVKQQVNPSVVLLHNVDPSWPPSEKDIILDAVRRIEEELKSKGRRVIEVPVSGADLAAVLAPFDPAEHIVFNWCEELPGIPRSDVRVAECLEGLGYTYTGSSPQVLALSWDKAAVKTLLATHGLPVPHGRILAIDDAQTWDRFPAIVKPAFEHCSLGVDSGAVVLDKISLLGRLIYIRDAFAQPALVEEFIDGREFHVTLWGNGRVEMLPPAEMDFSAFDDVRDRLCTFDSKFTPGSPHFERIELRIPARMTESEALALRRTAVAAYRQVGCRDYARIDLRLRDELFYVLDVNPNADISPDTSLAYAAEAAGMGFGAFITGLVGLADARHPVGLTAEMRP